MTSTSSSDTSGTSLPKIELTETQVLAFSNALLDYGLYVMAHSSPLILDASPFLSSNKSGFAANSTTTNICVSPLPLVRAWALLSFAAVGKTKKALGKFLQNITMYLVAEDKSIHDVLAFLNLPFVRIPQCLQLFSENQPVIPLNKPICEKMERYYSTQNSPSPICPMNFSGDDDGLASITRINKEAQKCSGNFLRYVVREENGPNRRTRMVLLSSIDCTFYWKFDGKRGPLTRCPFYESAGDGRTSDLFVWPCEGAFRCSVSGSEKLLELESHVEGFKLYLYESSGPPTSTSFEQALSSLPESKTFQKICVPHFSVMCPLRLSECTNNKGKFGLRRIFDREKSDLSGIYYRSHSFYPYFVTLWEHYHKAKFTITSDKPPAQKAVKNEVDRSRYGVAVEERNMLKRMRRDSIYRVSKADPHKYYDSEEPDCTKEAGLDAKQLDSYLKFDAPFYFMVLKENGLSRMILCVGRFNNAAATYLTMEGRGQSRA